MMSDYPHHNENGIPADSMVSFDDGNSDVSTINFVTSDVSTVSAVSSASSETRQCYNCHTTRTDITYTKDSEGNLQCGPCQSYRSLNGKLRPIELEEKRIRNAKAKKAEAEAQGSTVNEGEHTCVNCKDKYWGDSNRSYDSQCRCHACWHYIRTHGTERPERLYTKKRKRMPPKKCLECGNIKKKGEAFRKAEEPNTYRCRPCHRKVERTKKKASKPPRGQRTVQSLRGY